MATDTHQIILTMLVQEGVATEEKILQLQTDAFAAEARGRGFSEISNVKKLYQEPVEKALRSVRQVVKENLPDFVRDAGPTQYGGFLFCVYSADVA